MNILIMGAGALGSVFGGFLSRENKISLVGRSIHIKAIKDKGLRISGIWGEHLFKDLLSTISVEDIKEKQNLIFVTTKSYDTRAAVEAVKHVLRDDGYLITMQNGIGNEDVAAEFVGKNRTIGGMAIFGATLMEPGHVKVTVYASECLVGEIGKRTGKAKEIAAIIRKTGIPTLPSDDIIRDKWMKAFYNIALNPLSAILRVPYGFLGEHEETKALMYNLLAEAFQVAQAEHIALKYDIDSYFEFLIERQVPPTASHRSSMLQDIERGKKTEIDYLNGFIVERGKVHGIPTPNNKTITQIIKSLEKTCPK
jgi:2-dehydropantoate 2-reductase